MILQYKTTVRATDTSNVGPISLPGYAVGRMIEDNESKFSDWVFCAVPKFLIKENQEREFGDMTSYMLCFGRSLQLLTNEETINKDFPPEQYKFRLFPPNGVLYIACVDIGLEGILIQLEQEVL